MILVVLACLAIALAFGYLIVASIRAEAKNEGDSGFYPEPDDAPGSLHTLGDRYVDPPKRNP